MVEGFPKQFSSPEEEITYLREQIAAKEREALLRSPEADKSDIETIAKKEIFEYGTFTPNTVLAKNHQLHGQELSSAIAAVEVAHDPVEEIVQIALEKGVHNALTVMEKSSSPHAVDEVHRRLTEIIKEGIVVQDLKEGVPPWHVLHMTLFEVSLPEFRNKDKEGIAKSVSEIIGMMEQFYAGMQSVGRQNKGDHYVLEIANPDNSDHIIFYVSVPNEYIDLFEKQVHSLYPNAVVTEQKHDYNIFVEGGSSLMSVASLKKHPIYPLQTKEAFESDTLFVLLNAFSKIEREGGGASLQILIKSASQKYIADYEKIIERIRDGMTVRESISRSSLTGEILATLHDFMNESSTQKNDTLPTTSAETDIAEVLSSKINSPIIEVNIRVAVSAKLPARANQILSEIEATFHQFERARGNSLVFKRQTGKNLTREIKSYSFREFSSKEILPLSLLEMATMLHFPGLGIDSSPQFKQSHANTAPAPTDMPEEGTLLGVNKHRGVEKQIYVTEEDRMRHFYVVGQTGTGKSVFMKNIIIQDIQAGSGVCMIDPHGNDIQDVISSVPPEREKDIIYFDPSNLDRVIGLNMLEYDIYKPEQKTFVVNELFSIFQRLYGANPESMGPMFEQYFRNATLLVMDDPDSGNTLMDISRVMSDASYRRMKLSKAKNQVVVQFWQEIATKAGGEVSLENISRRPFHKPSRTWCSVHAGSFVHHPRGREGFSWL